MKDFQLTNNNLYQLIEDIQIELEKDKLIIVNTQPAGTGKWGMARLWRAWMATTAKFMSGKGVKMPLMIKHDGSWYGEREFNSEDAHELFTRQWLGVDADGVRLSWSKKGNNGMRPATKGERFNALRLHENWCVEKGIVLFKPRDSEYAELENKQQL